MIYIPLQHAPRLLHVTRHAVFNMAAVGLARALNGVLAVTCACCHMNMGSECGISIAMQIEQDGWVTIVAYSTSALEAALKIVRDTVAEIEPGQIYRCRANILNCWVYMICKQSSSPSI